MSAIDVDVISVDQIIDILEGDGSEIDVETQEVINGGTRNYNDLTHKPKIEGVELQGDKTFEDLNLASISNSEIEDLLSLSF